jgi:hypothetical protein
MPGGGGVEVRTHAELRCTPWGTPLGLGTGADSCGR